MLKNEKTFLGNLADAIILPLRGGIKHIQTWNLDEYVKHRLLSGNAHPNTLQ